MIGLLNVIAAANICDKSGGFFGLISWYHYLDQVKFDSKCNIQNFTVLPQKGVNSDIPLVLLAVIDDLLRIAGIVAVGFVIYGAVQYIISQGNPDQTAKAQSTIVNALIGMAIAIIAVVSVSFLGNKLGGG